MLNKILTRKQQIELIASIKGRGEVPLKFAYLGQGAYNWIEIAKKRQKYGVESLESKLLNKRVKNFVNTFSGRKINIIDLGCGDGLPAIPVIDILRELNFIFKYVPVDISQELLRIASKNIRNKFSNIKIIPIQLDFESGNFSDVIYEISQEGFSNLFLYLGTTLGNFDNPYRSLINFRDSMTADDFLLIGIELTNFSLINKLVIRYKNEKENKKFLYFIPKLTGINEKNTIYDIKWNGKDNQVEANLILMKDIFIKIGKEKFKVEKDEQILIGRSRKYTEHTITNLLSEIGFRNELLTTNYDRSYLLTLVQPTRHRI